MIRKPRKKKAETPAPHPLSAVDAMARAALAALLTRLPAQPTAAALALRLPDGIVVVPVGPLGDVLALLTSGRELVFEDGAARVTYGLTTPTTVTPPKA